MKRGILLAILLIALSLKNVGQKKLNVKQMDAISQTPMKQFSLLVRVPTTYTKEQAKTVNPAWDLLLQKRKDDHVFVTSFAFPGESYVVYGPEKKVKQESVICDNLRVVSNIVLLAETIEEASNLAKDCPILKYGGSVEIREVPGLVKRN